MTLIEKTTAAAANLAKLPDHCFAKMPGTGEIIGIVRGEMGYNKIVGPKLTVEELNQGLANKAQVEAMLSGSMFGWHIPAADADLYDEDGIIIKSKLRSK